MEDQAFIARDPLIDEFMGRPSTARSNTNNNSATNENNRPAVTPTIVQPTNTQQNVRVEIINRGPIDRSRKVLFPDKKGIIVEDQAFVARDPLMDDFMGRRSSLGEVLRKQTIMPGNAREDDDDAAVAEPMIAGPIHPNHMNLREMQMELRERNVYFGDCFDRDSLIQRLVEARNEDRGGYGN